ncbi:MAG: O-antigen polysaccharide polymerase Wzy [Sarcina sp.]
MKKEINLKFIIFYILLLMYMAVVYININGLITQQSVFKLNEIITIIFYVILLVVSFAEGKKLGKNFTLFTAFIIMFGLFLMSTIVLDILNLYHFGQTNFFTYYIFQHNVIMKILQILQVAIIGLYIGGLIFWRHERKSVSRNNIQEIKEIDPLKRKIFLVAGAILFLIGYFPTLYKTILELKVTQSEGYIGLYQTTIQAGHLVNLLSTFTIIGFVLILTYAKSTKIIAITIIIYGINLGAALLTGARANTFIVIIVILVYLSNRFKNKIKLKYIVLCVIIMVGIGQSISFLRNKEQVKSQSFLTTFLEQQGSSYTVIGYSVEYKDAFTEAYKKQIVFRPLINLIEYNKLTGKKIATTNTYEAAKYRAYTYGISYMVNPDYYFRGLGIGGCYLGSVWIGYGLIGVLIVNILIAVFLSYLDKKSEKGELWMFITFLIGINIIFVPRGILLNFIPYMVRPLQVYFVIFIIYKVIQSKKRRFD